MENKYTLKIRHNRKHNVVGIVQKYYKETIQTTSVSYKDIYAVLKIYWEDDSIVFIQDAIDKHKKGVIKNGTI